MAILEKLNEIVDMQLANMREHSPVMFSPFGAILATLTIAYAAKGLYFVFCILSGVSAIMYIYVLILLIYVF